MARRSMTGQLNMFELLNSLEEVPAGEVEMVSLMPLFDEETDEAVESTEVVSGEDIVDAREVVENNVLIVQETYEKAKVSTAEDTQEGTEQNKTEIEKEALEEVEWKEPSWKEDVELKGFSQEVEKPVMSRSYEVNGESIEVAYLNYNKVRITRAGMEPEMKVFASTKEAVDYYVQIMQEWEKDEE